MNRIEAKHLSIEFLNRAYELVELAETHPNDCPQESRYLSHGYSLKLESFQPNNVTYLILFKKDKDDKEDWMRYNELLVEPDIMGGFNVDYGLPSYMLNLYIARIIDEEG